MRVLFASLQGLPSPPALHRARAALRGGNLFNPPPDATMAQRPLSPHLQIWKWGPHMAVSILHRVTGDGLALVGLGVLLWWLGAMAGGAASYQTFTDVMASPVGMIVLVGLSWAFFTHMMSGLRHFVLDMGAGYELTVNKTWSIVAPLLGILLTALFWAAILAK